MLFQYNKNSVWHDINSVGDNEIFDNLDGYSGSETVVFFRIVNSTGDIKRNNVLLRLVEVYNNIEFPLQKSTDCVVTSGGNPKLDKKLQYFVKSGTTLGNYETGVLMTPDDNGLIKRGDLEAENGIINFAVKVKTDGKVLLSFGEILKVSDIYFYFTATTK